MVEQDTRAGKQVVTLAIIDSNVMSKHLRHPIWTTGIERRGLRLRNFQNLSEHLT